MGFGLEPTELPTEKRYWEGDDLDVLRVDGKRRRWLVSGCGDGALTDLFRLCLEGFRHDQMLRDYARDPRMRGVRDEIRRIESDAAIQDDPVKLHDVYRHLDAPWWSRRCETYPGPTPRYGSMCRRQSFSPTVPRCSIASLPDSCIARGGDFVPGKVQSAVRGRDGLAFLRLFPFSVPAHSWGVWEWDASCGAVTAGRDLLSSRPHRSRARAALMALSGDSCRCVTVSIASRSSSGRKPSARSASPSPTTRSLRRPSTPTFATSPTGRAKAHASGSACSAGSRARSASSRSTVTSPAPRSSALAWLAKHIAFWRQRSRRARADNKKRRKKRQRPQRFIPPFLWIITAGAPTALLKKLRLEHAPGWPAGVYLFGDSVLRVGIVVASKLPRDRSTILVRLMAAGALLPPTIKELGLLPPKAYERSVAEPILLSWHSMLRQKPNRSPEEQKFIMTMHQTWEEARAEARTETQAKAVLTALAVRGIAVPAAARKRILAEKDLKQLERWFKKAVVAKSLEEVLASRRRVAPTMRRQHA